MVLTIIAVRTVTVKTVSGMTVTVVAKNATEKTVTVAVAAKNATGKTGTTGMNVTEMRGLGTALVEDALDLHPHVLVVMNAHVLQGGILMIGEVVVMKGRPSSRGVETTGSVSQGTNAMIGQSGNRTVKEAGRVEQLPGYQFHGESQWQGCRCMLGLYSPLQALMVLKKLFRYIGLSSVPFGVFFVVGGRYVRVGPWSRGKGVYL